MHFIIGFAVLVAIFALFPRTAIAFAGIAGGLGVIALVISIIANMHQ